MHARPGRARSALAPTLYHANDGATTNLLLTIREASLLAVLEALSPKVRKATHVQLHCFNIQKQIKRSNIAKFKPCLAVPFPWYYNSELPWPEHLLKKSSSQLPSAATIQEYWEVNSIQINKISLFEVYVMYLWVVSEPQPPRIVYGKYCVQ